MLVLLHLAGRAVAAIREAKDGRREGEGEGGQGESAVTRVGTVEECVTR